MVQSCAYLLRARSGCLTALLRVPRPAGSSFTYAEHSGSPIPAIWSPRAKNKVSTWQQHGGGARQSEVKELLGSDTNFAATPCVATHEPQARRIWALTPKTRTRTAAGAPTLLRVQKMMLPIQINGLSKASTGSARTGN